MDQAMGPRTNASVVGRRGDRPARRGKGACREHVTDEQHRQTGWIGGLTGIVILARALWSNVRRFGCTRSAGLGFIGR